MTDTLPAGTTFASASATGATCKSPKVGGTGTVTCTATSLASGGSFDVTLVVNVTAASVGNLTDTASVSSATFDPVASNNSAIALTSVQ